MSFRVLPQPGSRTRALWRVVGLALGWCAACTPIKPLAPHGPQADAGVGAGAGGSSTPPSDAGTGGAPPGAAAAARIGDACAGDGARSCGGHATSQPLLCKGGLWQAEPACADDERCDSAAGANQGHCSAIARECLGHDPGVPFCDVDVQRVCDDLVSSRVIDCGAEHHCVPGDAGVICACVPGYVDNGSGCHRSHRLPRSRAWLRSAHALRDERGPARLHGLSARLWRRRRPRLCTAAERPAAVARRAPARLSARACSPTDWKCPSHRAADHAHAGGSRRTRVSRSTAPRSTRAARGSHRCSSSATTR